MAEIQLHCTFCGHSFGAATGWPRACSSCKRTTFRNPIPVAVVLQPVALPNDAVGLLVIRRNVEPAKGRLALPGGYVDDREDWRAAAVRELREEAGLVVAASRVTVQTYEILSNPEGDRVLIFALLPPVAHDALPAFVPTSETSERVVITAAQEMAFSTHTEMVARFFAA